MGFVEVWSSARNTILNDSAWSEWLDFMSHQDWDVIVLPLHDPRLPLTNNAAERQLRHYVIARRISFGTRTPVGSHSMALLASIIDTCRLRRANATELLARAIHAARMGLPAPALPPIPTDLVYSSDDRLVRV
ncbi:MAG: transposase [Burkholderiales bacterium]|nr:transposase [Burkholderiales bacterium]